MHRIKRFPITLQAYIYFVWNRKHSWWNSTPQYVTVIKILSLKDYALNVSFKTVVFLPKFSLWRPIDLGRMIG